MEEVLHYLDLKNQYYEKFLTVTTRFLESANRDVWPDIDAFVDSRERILAIIRSFDFKIAEAFDRLDGDGLDLDAYRSRVKVLMDRRTAIANRIVAVDLELISKLDDVKTDTIRDLRRSIATEGPIDPYVTAPPAAPPKPTKPA